MCGVWAMNCLNGASWIITVHTGMSPSVEHNNNTKLFFFVRARRRVHLRVAYPSVMASLGLFSLLSRGGGGGKMTTFFEFGRNYLVRYCSSALRACITRALLLPCKKKRDFSSSSLWLLVQQADIRDRTHKNIQIGFFRFFFFSCSTPILVSLVLWLWLAVHSILSKLITAKSRGDIASCWAIPFGWSSFEYISFESHL